MGIERPLGGNRGLGGCRAGGRKRSRDDHGGGGFHLGDRPGDHPRAHPLRRHASARGSHARGAGDHGLPGLGGVVRGRGLLLQQRLEPAGHERLRAVHHAADRARAGREGGIRLAMALADEEGAGQGVPGAHLRAQALASAVDHAGASSTNRRNRGPGSRLRGLSRRRGHVQPRVRLLDHARRSAHRVRHLTRSDDLAGSRLPAGGTGVLCRPGRIEGVLWDLYHWPDRVWPNADGDRGRRLHGSGATGICYGSVDCCPLPLPDRPEAIWPTTT